MANSPTIGPRKIAIEAMFFIVSKIVAFLLDPIFYILLFSLFCIFKKRRGFRFYVFSIGLFCCFFLISTKAVSNVALIQLENFKPSSQRKKHYDAVIVLSGMTKLPNSTMNRVEFNAAADRILAGVELTRDDAADYLIVSGGNGALSGGEKSEAILLEKFAARWGIDPDRILAEATSRNTFENAQESAKIIQKRGFKKLLLITSAFHMYRAHACFVRAGIDTDTLSVDYRGERTPFQDFRRYLPSSEGLYQFSRMVHELIGIAVYWITGKAQFQ